MSGEGVSSALERKAAEAPAIPTSGPSVLEKRAAELAASVTTRTRARPPIRKLDFSSLEQSRFGLKGVFACLFLFNAALIGGLMIADKHYKFSPMYHENEWESVYATKQRFKKLREQQEKEKELLR